MCTCHLPAWLQSRLTDDNRSELFDQAATWIIEQLFAEAAPKRKVKSWLQDGVVEVQVSRAATCPGGGSLVRVGPGPPAHLILPLRSQQGLPKGVPEEDADTDQGRWPQYDIRGAAKDLNLCNNK
jgi:hypothetical protein